ncbi:hypothetical protein [Paenibacillus alvei]|uniref:hypothetical protein n=1 Tax=Paenibacillus alvei TaxID=44250 RepID=UPI00227F3191|nr:hypothetical protein [Paenibacillus alvei]
MNNFTVMLANKWEIAQTLKPHVTVEAEYGDNVLEGSVLTLAHHSGRWANNPAPCNTHVHIDLPDDALIVISHIDLDTVGGIAAVLGCKVDDKDFWAAAEYVDINGPHYGYKLPEQLPKLQAYWAWNYNQPKISWVQARTDVTKEILTHIKAITRILNGDSELIEAGQKWAAETTAKVEGCLIEENEYVRVFASDDVFCGAAYHSPQQERVVPVIVSYNTKFGSVTVSMEDGGKKCSAKGIVQNLWGEEAGGHDGIAGSPRGTRMSLSEFYRAVKYARSVVSSF